MTLKKESNKLGKLIRKLTGIPFVKAMKMAKVVIREGEYSLPNKFPEEVEKITHCDYCSDGPYVLKGSKGGVEVDYISKNSLQRELDMIEFFKKNPGQTFFFPIRNGLLRFAKNARKAESRIKNEIQSKSQ